MLCQGCELITANYMFCTFACLAAAPEDRANEIKATVINWFVCWWLNLAGAILHFVIFAWQTGLIKTVTIDNDIWVVRVRRVGEGSTECMIQLGLMYRMRYISETLQKRGF